MGLFNRLKKLTGYEPIKTVNLGFYDYQEQLDGNNYDRIVDQDNIKIKVSMNYYETNSIKILFDFESGEKMIFDAIETPYIYGDEVKINLMAENKLPAYLYKNFKELRLINPTTKITVVLKNRF